MFKLNKKGIGLLGFATGFQYTPYHYFFPKEKVVSFI